MARDNGLPSLNSTSSVRINVASGASSPPTWDQDYDNKVYNVSETAVGIRIAVMKCYSNIADDRVEFQIITDDSSSSSSSQSTGTFSISYVSNTLYLSVDGKLDYETTSSYTVRLRCLVSMQAVHVVLIGRSVWCIVAVFSVRKCLLVCLL